MQYFTSLTFLFNDKFTFFFFINLGSNNKKILFFFLFQFDEFNSKERKFIVYHGKMFAIKKNQTNPLFYKIIVHVL